MFEIQDPFYDGDGEKFSTVNTRATQLSRFLITRRIFFAVNGCDKRTQLPFIRLHRVAFVLSSVIRDYRPRNKEIEGRERRRKMYETRQGIRINSGIHG